MQDEIAESDHPRIEQAPAEVALDMKALVEKFRWEDTPLGPSSNWPDSLRTAVQIVLTSRFAMWMGWGPELTFLYNDAYARMTLGRKHPWALGRPAREVWAEIWKDISPRIQQVLETGQATWDEGLRLILERDGYPEETYHTFSYSPLSAGDGQITGMLCVVTEDTARLIGERQLASLRLLASGLASAISEPDMLASIQHGLEANRQDLPFTLTYLFEDQGSQLTLVCRTGIGSDHPAACTSIDIHSPLSLWPVGKMLIERSGSMVIDLLQRFPDLPLGPLGMAPVQAMIVPIAKQGQEAPAGVLITALNPFRQLNADYAGFIGLIAGQIAAGVANARAYEDERKRAESLAELDRAKTTFFSNVSHELRTPLTLMLGPIEDSLAAGTPPSPESLAMLHRNALRLLKLVNTLLDFARIEAGRMKATYQETDLAAFTADLASVFRSAVERVGVRLEVDCPPLPEPVFVDREMWEKVILNLLSNALKSTFDGEIRVTMRARGSSVQLSIADTGTGIPPADLPKLFDRFNRIEGARRRSNEGTGIGLALVRELIELLGGSIQVASHYGSGTTFTISIPFGHAHLSSDRIRSDSGALGTNRETAAEYVHEALGWFSNTAQVDYGLDHLQGGTNIESGNPTQSDEKRPVVLLVDDNADMRAYVSSLLRVRFHVIPVENGKIALEIATLRRPDLVLTDVMMPELDGFGLIAALRQNPSTRTVPVIMLSARAGDEARIEGIEATADDYMTKPFTARELMARVEAHLKMAKLRQEAVEQEVALTNEVRKAQQLAAEALEHISDAVYIYDHELNATYMNPAAEEIARRIERPGDDGSPWELYPRIAGTAMQAFIHRAMEQRAPAEFEYYFAPWERWYLIRAYPQASEGVIAYVRDTTEARKTEQVLRRSEQLAAAGRLAVSISHEINNPLEALTNLLYLAKSDNGLSGKARDLLEIADRELQRLSHIAARSLKFYKQRTSPTLTSLEEVLESVLFFLETRIKSGDVRLERRYRQAPRIFCFAGEVQQVFMNLIGNALDALPVRGRLVIAVAPATQPDGRKGVRVVIADGGSGMDENTTRHLFHPFFTTKGESGTGLGLWVSKGILENQGADVQVRSKLGHGTVFRLFFPMDSIPVANLAANGPRSVASA